MLRSLRVNPRVVSTPYAPIDKWKVVKRAGGWHVGLLPARNQSHAESIRAEHLPHEFDAGSVKGDVFTRRADGTKWKLDTPIALPTSDSSAFAYPDGSVCVQKQGEMHPAAHIVGAIVK